MGGLLVAALLMAEPTAAVVLARRTAVPPAEAQALTAAVLQQLTGSALPGVLDATETERRLARLGLGDALLCEGKGPCLAELGRQVEVAFLVLVSASQVGSEQSLALELFRVADARVPVQESMLLPQRGEVPPSLVERFAGRSLVHRRPPTPDAPVAEKPALAPPTPPPPPPRAVAPLPAPRRPLTPFVLGGAGVVALGAGVALLVAGLGARATLSLGTPQPDGTVHSPLTGSEAQAAAQAAGLQLGLAGLAGAVGLGLGAGAALTW